MIQKIGIFSAFVSFVHIAVSLLFMIRFSQSLLSPTRSSKLILKKFHYLNSVSIHTSNTNTTNTSESKSDWYPDYSPYKKDFKHLNEHQWDQLKELSLKLYDWNTKINVVSRKDIEFLIPNHIIPCLSMSLIRNFDNGETVIDVGTGGGLPGLPMAIACPNALFTLVDSNQKKMMVVKDIATSMGLKNVRVICCRAEVLNETFDFMLGRAVINLPFFLGFSSHFIDGKSNSIPHKTLEVKKEITISSGLLYLKGGDFSNELQEAGIKDHTLFQVSDLAPSISPGKVVLYIPANEIIKNRAANKKKVA